MYIKGFLVNTWTSLTTLFYRWFLLTALCWKTTGPHRGPPLCGPAQQFRCFRTILKGRAGRFLEKQQQIKMRWIWRNTCLLFEVALTLLPPRRSSCTPILTPGLMVTCNIWDSAFRSGNTEDHKEEYVDTKLMDVSVFVTNPLFSNFLFLHTAIQEASSVKVLLKQRASQKHVQKIQIVTTMMVIQMWVNVHQAAVLNILFCIIWPSLTYSKPSSLTDFPQTKVFH